MPWPLPLLHALVDGVCAAALFSRLEPLMGGALFSHYVLLYDLLAFATQGLTGLLADGLRRHKLLLRLACLLVALGGLLPLPPLPRVLALGLGNSLFHVAGGALCLKRSGGRAWPLGVFVAPGAVGLACGIQFPALCTALALLLAALCLLPLRAAAPPRRPQRDAPACWPAAGLLLLCVFARSFGGFALPFSWNTTVCTALLLALCTAGGKALGGFLCDWRGPRVLSLLSIPLAALLTALCPGRPLPALLGQLLLNLSMPVTLLLLDRALPGSPGFSFGLAASALLPGMFCAQLLPASQGGRALLALAVAAVNLASILWALALLRRKPRAPSSFHL